MQLTVRVLPGGAERGAEIAAVQYVNAGAAACTIRGFPTAVLLRGGKAIGTVSRPNTSAARSMRLGPGDIAESLLTDFSSCQAPLSDNVRVTLPALRGVAGAPAVGAVRLRACTLRAAPVGPPA
ncbi:MAG: DUF4232 domain-containing protein [Jatrophihabitans sp.]